MHCTFLDGILEGNVVDGEMIGFGRLIYEDGSSCEVEYCDKCKKMNVHGKLIYADGEVNEVNGVNDRYDFFPIGNIEGVTAYGEWTACPRQVFLSQ